MKKIFIFIVIAVSAIMLNSCGSAKNFSANNFVEEGTGVSREKDIAFDKAVNNALIKITNEYSSVVNANERRIYASSNNGNSKDAETFNYESDASNKSAAKIDKYEIKKRKYVYNKFKNLWTCSVTVSVPIKNVN